MQNLTCNEHVQKACLHTCMPWRQQKAVMNVTKQPLEECSAWSRCYFAPPITHWNSPIHDARFMFNPREKKHFHQRGIKALLASGGKTCFGTLHWSGKTKLPQPKAYAHTFTQICPNFTQISSISGVIPAEEKKSKS